MKKGANGLYQLVNGMSPREKRYFREESQRKTETGGKYRALFEAILEQKETDESALREHFEAKYPGKRFEVLKAYLFERVLNALHQYHAHSSQAAQIMRLIHESDLLVGRGLQREALRTLEKARKRARRYEYIHFLPDIIRRLRQLRPLGPNIAKWREWAFALLDDEEAAIADLANEVAMARQMSRLYFLYMEDGQRPSAATLEQAHAIAAHPMMAGPEAARTFLGRVLYYNACYFYTELLGDKQAGLTHMRDFVAHLESRPLICRDRPRMYLLTLHNYLMSQDAVGAEADFLSTLDRLQAQNRQLEKRGRHTELVTAVRLREHTLRTTFLIKRNRYAEAAARGAEIESMLKGLAEYRDQLRVLNLWMALASAYLATGDYAACLRALQAPLQASRGETRATITLSVHLMHVLAHFELGNIDLLEPLIRAFYRRLRQKPRLDASEEVILYIIRNRLPRAADPNGGRKALASARQALEDAGLTPSQIRNTWAFDLAGYLAARLSGKTLAEATKG